MGYLMSRRVHFPSAWENNETKSIDYDKDDPSQRKCVLITLGYFACFWCIIYFPLVAVNWASVPKDISVMWSATIQQQDMIGAGFAHEAIDFLVPLASHVYVGWVNERSLNPFRSEDSAFHDLRPADQQVLRTIYNQGLEMRSFSNQILLLQFQPQFYEKYLNDYSNFKDFKYKIGRCMFETTSVPHEWINMINEHLDEIWVPSKFQKVVFLREGVFKRIVVIKEGFDPEVYNRNKTLVRKKKIFNQCAQDYVFIASSKWEDRKGWDVLLEAFTEEFTGMDSVCLAIRSTGLTDQLLEVHNPNHARIIKVDRLSNEDHPSFYASADAFVLPSHGEGWGRTAMEAMALGLPTIATKWSGLSEFISPEYAIPINVTEVEPAFPNEPFSLGSEERLHQAHKWARVDKYAVRGAMRWVYNNQDSARDLGRKAEKYMHTHYTRDKIAEDIHQRLLQIHHMEFRNRDISDSKDHQSL